MHAINNALIIILQPASKVLFVEPKTINYYASFVGSSMTITGDNAIMHFPTGGSRYEELIRVPLGTLDPQVVIRVTVAIKPRPDTEDSDPHIGLTDGVGDNRIRISDSGGDCQIREGSDINANNLPSGSNQHYEYILIFEPFQKYGACSHFGGHVTPGYFNTRIDASKGLDFVVKRESSGEQYDFYYFLIEIL